MGFGFILMIVVAMPDQPVEHYSVVVNKLQECIALRDATMREYSDAHVKAKGLCMKSFEI